MTRAELYNGRGSPTPLHEVTVFWPAYYATKHRMDAERAAERRRAEERQRRAI